MDIPTIYGDIKAQQLTVIDDQFKFLVFLRHIWFYKTRLQVTNDEILSYLFLNLESMETLENEDSFFGFIYSICQENIPSNTCVSYLLTSFLDNRFASFPGQIGEYIASVRNVSLSLDLLIEHFSDIRSNYYYELLFKLENTSELNVEQCFKRIITNLKNIDSKDMYFRYKFIINGENASISGLIFHKLSFFENVENDNFSEGVFQLLRYVNSIDLDFLTEFTKFYSKTKKDLEEMSSNIGPFFEDF